METSSEAFNENKVRNFSILIIWSEVAPLTRDTRLKARTSWWTVCTANMGNYLQERVQSKSREEKEVDKKKI